MQLILLDAEELRACVPMALAIDLMASAFAALSRGDAVVPPRTALRTAAGRTLVMPGWVPSAGGAPGGLATKLVSVHPGNRERGLPAVHAVVVVLDPDTGAPTALLDGTSLTALRTGAATGLATRLLAREDARVLAVFGAGGQARDQIAAVRAVRPIEEVRIVSGHGASARALAGELDGVEARAVEDPREALRGAGVVVTATDSATPVFPGSAVEEGTHVNGVGSYTLDMREVDAELVRRSLVVVDSREAARAEAGDLAGAVADGAIGWDHVHAELGEVVEGVRPGRTSPSQVTFFKSVGSAVQDVVVASAAVAEARRRGFGELAGG